MMTDVQTKRFDSLTSRVIRASLWSGALRSGLRSIGFVRNVVLARVLAPEDIGLFGMALVVLSVIERFSNTGLTAALVQRKESIDEYLNSAWTVQVLRGTALAALLMLVAPGAAAFFEEQAVAPLIRVLGVTVFLRGLKNPGIVQLQRELDVRRQFLIRSGGASMDLLVSIAASIVLRSAWGLMFGLLAASLTNLLLSYVMHPFRPRLRLDIAQMKSLSSFGIWVFLNDVLFFLAYRGDNLVVGKVLGSVALGAYILAFSISEVVTVEVSRMFTEVVFPAYSRIQDQAERLRRAFCLGLEVVTSVTFPAAVILFLLAEPIVGAAFGHRWAAVAVVLPPLALAGAIRALLAGPGAVFNALGKPNHTFRMNLVGVLVTYALMLGLVSHAGLLGVGWAVAGGMLVTIPVAFVSTRRLLGLGASALARPLLPAMLLTAGVAAPIIVIGPMTGDYALPQLGLRIGVAALGYLAVSAVLWWRFRAGPLALGRVVTAVEKRSAYLARIAMDARTGTVAPSLERVPQGD